MSQETQGYVGIAPFLLLRILRMGHKIRHQDLELRPLACHLGEVSVIPLG